MRGFMAGASSFIVFAFIGAPEVYIRHFHILPEQFR